MSDELLLYVLVWAVCGILAYLIADRRQARDSAAWFLVGVLLGPIGVLCAQVFAKPRP